MAITHPWLEQRGFRRDRSALVITMVLDAASGCSLRLSYTDPFQGHWTVIIKRDDVQIELPSPATSEREISTLLCLIGEIPF